jgi:4-hydroxy-tetrahydrodipicolinate synthase
MKSLEGVIAAATTPLRDDLSIDLDWLVRHCRRLLDDGCDGINLLGTTGEATSFSLEQRIAAMRAVADSGLPLDRFMVGTGAAALDDAVRLTAEAKMLGYAGALLLPPFYYKGIDAEGLTGYVETLIHRVGGDGLRLYLYHFPANSGVPYSVDVVARLRDAWPDTILGLKDSSGDLDYAADLVRTLPGFAVFPSAEASLGKAGQLGFAGCISATANVTGPFAQAAWSGASEALRSEGLAAAVEIRAAIAKFPLVASVKATLGLIDGEPEWNRLMPPLTRLTGRQLELLHDELKATGLRARLELD